MHKWGLWCSLLFMVSFTVAAKGETAPEKPSSFFETLLEQTKQPQAGQQAQACGGRNLVDELTPDDRKRLHQKAQSIVNGQGRFWKIEKSGLQPSWLFGTMHITDDRVNTLSNSEQNALEHADRVVLEVREIAINGSSSILDEALNNPEIFMVAQDQTIKDKLSEKDFEHFRSTLEQHGLNYSLISRTQPWLVWATLSIPYCEVLRKQTGLKALDEKIGLSAQQAGKPVIGLETLQEQTSVIMELPLAFHVHAILDSVKDSTHNQNLFYTQTVLYLKGDIATIMSLDEVYKGETTKDDIAAFNTILIDQRNARMAKRSAPLLEKGNSFIAVGAAHLPGQNGLIEHFRKLGYRVTRMDDTKH